MAYLQQALELVVNAMVESEQTDGLIQATKLISFIEKDPIRLGLSEEMLSLKETLKI